MNYPLILSIKQMELNDPWPLGPDGQRYDATNSSKVYRILANGNEVLWAAFDDRSHMIAFWIDKPSLPSNVET